jgi:hypothetical protein
MWRKAEMSEHPLETIYWIAQILLFIVAISAAYGGILQLQAYKLFETIKFVDDREFREARGVVVNDIGPVKDTKWWEGGHEIDHMRLAAYTVCSKYDSLQLLFEFDALDRLLGRSGYNRFFATNWSVSIIPTREALEEFINWRRKESPEAYIAYDRLYSNAKK